MARLKALWLVIALLFLFSAAGDPWAMQVEKYQKLLELAKRHYPDAVDERKVVEASIRGFLSGLDPHSMFLDSLSLRTLREDQRGNFYGVGIRVARYGIRLTVVAPLKGLPAERAGVSAGDIIAEIDGRKTQDISMETAMGLLRGAKDTDVEIKVQREGQKELLAFRLKRAFVPLDSITYAMVLPENPPVGYIGIRVFGSRTSDELKAALERLCKKDKVHGLILDLRDNPGGSLEAAVEIADFFLPKGKAIVAIRGRKINHMLTAEKDRQYEDLPMVVLVNRSSASASEIVAAALQDNHRAPVIGQRSWGKGLVEMVSPLSFGYALALTTARFYTPSGRALQRDYSSLLKYYTFAYSQDYDVNPDVAGGIRPDILVKPVAYSRWVRSVVSRGLLYDFSRRLGDAGFTVTDRFQADRRVMDFLRLFLSEKGVKVSPGDWEKDQAVLQEEVERQVFSDRFSLEAGMKVFLGHDPVCQKALEVLSNALEKSSIRQIPSP